LFFGSFKDALSATELGMRNLRTSVKNEMEVVAAYLYHRKQHLETTIYK
jgi:hypothetical protein